MRKTGFFLLIIALQPAHLTASDDSQLLSRLFTSYEALEGLVILVDARREQEGYPTLEGRFRVKFGFAGSRASPPPFSIEELVQNPGEPHLDSDQVAQEWIAVVDGVSGHFKRDFVSDPPVGGYSSLQLEPAEILYAPVFQMIQRGLQIGFGGAPAADTFGRVDSLVKGVPFHVVGEEKFQGLDCKRVSLTFNATTDHEWTGEYLVTIEPTVQILKVYGIRSENPAVSESLLDYIANRTVHEVKVLEGCVIPTHVTFDGAGVTGEIKVVSVESLDKGHHGLWEFDGPTGTNFVGSLELSMREGSGRETRNRHASRLPYTDAEMELIRAYQVAAMKGVPTQLSWGRIAFWVLNLTVLLVLIYRFYVFWRPRKAVL